MAEVETKITTSVVTKAVARWNEGGGQYIEVVYNSRWPATSPYRLQIGFGQQQILLSRRGVLELRDALTAVLSAVGVDDG